MTGILVRFDSAVAAFERASEVLVQEIEQLQQEIRLQLELALAVPPVPDLFVEGAFTSHSGETLHEKIECDALSKGSWACLARMIVRRLPPHLAWQAVGIPRGGLKLATELNTMLVSPFDSPIDSSVVYTPLVVDDVFTTGRSMYETMAKHPGSFGFVVFNRSGRPMPPRMWALFTLDADLPPLSHAVAARAA